VRLQGHDIYTHRLGKSAEEGVQYGEVAGPSGKGMFPEQGFRLAQFERGSKREGMEHQYKRVTSANLVQVIARTACSKLYSGSSPLAVFTSAINHPSNHHSYILCIRAVQGKIFNMEYLPAHQDGRPRPVGPQYHRASRTKV
jgi:hypothetical protein